MFQRKLGRLVWIDAWQSEQDQENTLYDKNYYKKEEKQFGGLKNSNQLMMNQESFQWDDN